MNNLKAIRRMAGFTQYRLAVRSGVGRTKLSLAESGDIELSSEEEKKIKKVLLKKLQHQAQAINEALTQKQQEEVHV